MGTRIDTKVWDALRERLRRLGRKGAHVRVGVMQSAGNAPSGISLVELAAVHEFGSPAAGIPERSFIRSTFRERGEQLVNLTTRLAKAVIAERSSIDEALGLLGAWGADQVKRTIRGFIEPPLKQKTIDRKGSDLPLVDTGQLINSITWEVAK
jgi:phage gpG-like protein